jgi:hypothetical protein
MPLSAEIPAPVTTNSRRRLLSDTPRILDEERRQKKEEKRKKRNAVRMTAVESRLKRRTSTAMIYLDCAIVKPGDILLTADATTESAFIRGLTRGPYSHAALILSPTARLEAAGDGTGHTTMFYERVERLSNPARGRFLHLLPTPTRRALLLRRPGLAEGHSNLFDDLTTLSRPFLWKEYPELKALASVFKKEVIRKAAVLPFLRVVDKLSTQPTNPGMFCSQLVAAIHETLGYPIVEGTPADEISPNMIAQQSELEEVSDAITEPIESAELDNARCELLNTVMKLQVPRAVLPGYVEFMTKVDELRKR